MRQVNRQDLKLHPKGRGHRGLGQDIPSRRQSGAPC